MDAVVIILIAGAAVAAVLVPLLQRGPATDPMLEDSPREPDGFSAQGASPSQELEQEVERYRAALRANTVCRRCGAANPAGSRFCAECGRRVGDASRKRVA